MATDDAEWKEFNPGFEHGEVNLRASNIDGVFSAEKLAHHGPEVVRTANCSGQMGDANFDWDAIDKQGADVRKANCTGELGSDNFDWASVDAKGADVRSPNMPANIDADAFDKVDLAGADVRKPNCTGQIGDADFNALIKKEQTPLTAAQVSWRLSVLPLAVALPLGLARAALAALPAGWNYTAAVGVGLAGAIVLSKLAKQIVMVKQGTLCFAQFFENGATHVLQAGVQPLASFGTTTQTFEVKEDAMNFGTVTFARVKPGFVGLATDNGRPVLLLPGQHLYNEPNFQLTGVKSVNDNVICNGPLNLIRVPPSMLGCATINKQPVLLDAGMHFLYSNGFQWLGTRDVTASIIENGPIKIIRVMPGYLGLATSAKKPVILGVGLHFLNDPAFEWSTLVDVKQNLIQHGPITVLRVEPNTVGLATINKKPLILDVGLHFIFEAAFEFAGARSVIEDLIQIGPVSIVRVGSGLIGLGTLNGFPLLLDVGVHFINEAGFQFSETKRVDEAVITLGPLNIITVARGKVAPVLVNGEGHFLSEGRHFVNQSRFVLLGNNSLTDEYIYAGTRHRIVVPRGKLGLAFEQGEPVLYEPGSIHLVNSPLFSYKGSVDITKQLVQHGSLKIITVKGGQIGITYNDGKLELLETGRHIITAATHVLAGFVSTGQQTLRISEVTGMSLDNVELTFDAAICIRVVDAQKAVLMLTTGRNDIISELYANVQERAKLDIATIIGKNRLNKKHDATTSIKEHAAAEKQELAETDGFEKVESPEGKDGGGGFRSAVHDNFMVLFKKEMLEDCGVEVINMAIEDVKIVDHDLAKALASAAVANSSLEKQTIEAEIVQVKATADARVAMIDAEGKASATKIMARAEAERIKIVSDALEKSCKPAQHQELIRTSGTALNRASTVLLAQDTGALATLLSGAQGANLGPSLK
jgi:regulator of protease activity HflC (stomatin/prohibitin superfamily)